MDWINGALVGGIVGALLTGIVEWLRDRSAHKRQIADTWNTYMRDHLQNVAKLLVDFRLRAQMVHARTRQLTQQSEEQQSQGTLAELGDDVKRMHEVTQDVLKAAVMLLDPKIEALIDVAVVDVVEHVEGDDGKYRGALVELQHVRAEVRRLLRATHGV